MKKMKNWKFNGEGLKKLREKNEISLDELKELLFEGFDISITKQMLYLMENGEIGYPSIRIVLGLASIFKKNHLVDSLKRSNEKFFWFVEKQK